MIRLKCTVFFSVHTDLLSDRNICDNKTFRKIRKNEECCRRYLINKVVFDVLQPRLIIDRSVYDKPTA